MSWRCFKIFINVITFDWRTYRTVPWHFHRFLVSWNITRRQSNKLNEFIYTYFSGHVIYTVERFLHKGLFSQWRQLLSENCTNWVFFFKKFQHEQLHCITSRTPKAFYNEKQLQQNMHLSATLRAVYVSAVWVFLWLRAHSAVNVSPLIVLLGVSRHNTSDCFLMLDHKVRWMWRQRQGKMNVVE